MLGGNDFFVSDRFSVADIAIGAQLTQLDLVVSSTYADRWPALATHTEAMKMHAGFIDNLTSCQKMLSKLVPEKVDLS